MRGAYFNTYIIRTTNVNDFYRFALYISRPRATILSSGVVVPHSRLTRNDRDSADHDYIPRNIRNDRPKFFRSTRRRRRTLWAERVVRFNIGSRDYYFSSRFRITSFTRAAFVVGSCCVCSPHITTVTRRPFKDRVTFAGIKNRLRNCVHWYTCGLLLMGGGDLAIKAARGVFRRVKTVVEYS